MSIVSETRDSTIIFVCKSVGFVFPVITDLIRSCQPYLQYKSPTIAQPSPLDDDSGGRAHQAASVALIAGRNEPRVRPRTVRLWTEKLRPKALWLTHGWSHWLGARPWPAAGRKPPRAASSLGRAASRSLAREPQHVDLAHSRDVVADTPSAGLWMPSHIPEYHLIFQTLDQARNLQLAVGPTASSATIPLCSVGTPWC